MSVININRQTELAETMARIEDMLAFSEISKGKEAQARRILKKIEDRIGQPMEDDADDDFFLAFIEDDSDDYFLDVNRNRW